ncbi:30S ribosomal protein S21 [Microvirga sp. KLBC 81]|nr:30S ribosomal protein S21 [Microvirga sp. KLBC 81]
MLVQVYDNDVDRALRALEKGIRKAGLRRDMRRHAEYEKPSERRKRRKALERADRRARLKAIREGLITKPVRKAKGGQQQQRVAVLTHRTNARHRSRYSPHGGSHDQSGGRSELWGNGGLDRPGASLLRNVRFFDETRTKGPGRADGCQEHPRCSPTTARRSHRGASGDVAGHREPAAARLVRTRDAADPRGALPSRQHAQTAVGRYRPVRTGLAEGGRRTRTADEAHGHARPGDTRHGRDSTGAQAHQVRPDPTGDGRQSRTRRRRRGSTLGLAGRGRVQTLVALPFGNRPWAHAEILPLL